MWSATIQRVESSGDDDSDEEEDDEEEVVEENIAEILMAQANKDMDEKKAKDLFDAQIKKKLILKKKSDKEYEAYWIKQKGEKFSTRVLFSCILLGFGIFYHLCVKYVLSSQLLNVCLLSTIWVIGIVHHTLRTDPYCFSHLF